MESDSVYFSRRAHEERLAAMKAPHPVARQAHLDLADRYHELSVVIESSERTTSPDFAGAA